MALGGMGAGKVAAIPIRFVSKGFSAACPLHEASAPRGGRLRPATTNPTHQAFDRRRTLTERGWGVVVLEDLTNVAA